MAIARLKPDAEALPQVTTPEAIKEPNKSTFTSLLPETKVHSLLKYVEGYPWTVHYYGQILNEYNTLENFDPSTPNLTQPYYEVKNLILQVSNPLSSSYDEETGVTTITGSAITPFKLKPNVGDIFIANVDSGEDAIFVIYNVVRKTYRKETLYEISYNLYAYTSQNPTFIDNLNARVQESFYFNKDTNYYNRDHLIIPRVKEAIDRLKNYLVETQAFYFSTFTHKGFGSIAIPGTTSVYYDPLLLEFISKTVEISNYVDKPFYFYNYLENKYIKQKSIFDLLLERNSYLVDRINKRFSFVDTGSIVNYSRVGSVFHAGVDYILFPVEFDKSLDIDPIEINKNTTTSYYSAKTEKNYYMPDPAIMIDTVYNENIHTKPLLHELFNSDYYVVSENFYRYLKDNSVYSDISYIELLISKFIKKEAIAKEDLVVAIQSYYSWSSLHQLYLLPLMWLLIRANL